MVRAHDWAATTLGAADTWPQSLRTVAGIVLNGGQPMFAAWGPELALIYNDGYAPILGGKHPAALGRPFKQVWSDIWTQFKPIVDRVMGGEAVYFDDLHIPMERHGYPEDTWFSFSYTPVPDETGRIGGFFCACTETTTKVLGERALRESEERFRAAADGSPAFIWVSDADGEVTFANEQYRRFFQVGPDEMLGDGWRRIVHPDDVEDFHRDFLEAFAARRLVHLSVRVIHPTQGVRWLNCDGGPRWDSAGRFLGYVGVNVDVTGVIEAQAALRESEEEYRYAAELNPQVVWTATPDGQLDRVSQRWREWTGTSGLGESWADGLHPDDRQRTFEVWAASFGTGEPYDIQHRVQFLNGDYRWARSRAFARRDAGGKVVRWYGTTEDIHDEKTAQDALAANERRFREMADDAPVILWTTDPEGYCTFLNDRWYDLTGQSPAEAEGLGWLNATHPDDKPAAEAAFLDANTRRTTFLMEYRLRAADGSYRWAIDIGRPRFGADGRYLGFVGSVVEIGERKAAEDAQARLAAERTAILSQLAEGVIVTGADGRIAYVNEAAVRLHGVERLDVPPEAYAESYSLFTEDGRPHPAEELPLARAVRGETVSEVRWRIRRPDGSEVLAIGGARPLLDPSGDQIGAILTLRDDTRRAETEGALRESEARFRTLVDTVPAFVWFAGPSGDLTFYNARWYAYTGLTQEQSMGAGWVQTLHPDDVASTAAIWEEARARGQSYVVECRYRRLDGAYRWFVARAEPVRDEGGRITGWFGTSTDIDDRKTAEAALAESEHRFRDIADSIDQMVWSTRPDGWHDYYNRRWYEFTGMPEGSTDGEDWAGMFHPDDQPNAWARWTRSLETGEPYHVEYRLRRHDGEWRWVLGRALPVRDEAGRISRWYGTCTDIHEQKLVEAQLSSIMDAVPVGVLLAEAPSGRLLRANRYMETLLRRRVRLLGDVPDYGAREAYRPDGERMSEEDWPIHQVLATGRPAETETRFRRGDDSYGWLRIQAAPVRDSAGAMIGAVAGVTDVDEIIQAREILTRSREELEQRAEELAAERDRLWTTSQDLLVVADQEGLLKAVNPAWERLLGWTEAELLGRTTDWLQIPEETERIREDAARHGPELTTYRFEHSLRTRDGGYRQIAWTLVQEAGLIFAIGRDVSAEKEQKAALERVQDQLRQAQKMEAVGQLTGGVAHDFNNLLQIVVGNLELLQRSLPDDAVRQRRSVDNAMSGARRAVTLTQRLLAFSRRQPLEPRPVAVNKLVSGMSELLSRSLGETVQLETVLAAGLWRVEADPNQLENAILNLAVNARDAMPDGGRLTIETANTRLDETYVQQNVEVSPGQYVVICVSDTGVGMDKEVASRVFEPFFTTKEVGKGTGLGAQPGVRLRQTVRRPCEDLFGAGGRRQPRHHRQALPAPLHRRGRR
jgi:PAS domain S-box-containing protein